MKRILLIALLIYTALFRINSQDLVIDSVICENEVLIGTTITMNTYCSNIDSIYSSGFYIRYFLSKDPTYDYFDYNINQRYISDLNGNSQVNNSRNFNTSGFEAGNYYLIIIADSYDNINETNENNNIFTKTITLTESNADLIISDFTLVNDTAEVNGMMQGSYTVKNIGAEPTVNNFYSYVYISKEPNTNNVVYLIGRYFNDSIHANDSVIVNFTVYYQNYDLGPGDYYLVALADNYNYIGESDENNNSAFKEITLDLSTDLHASNISTPAVSSAGSRFHFSFIINKSTSEVIDNVQASYYLSSDNTLSDDDYFIEGNGYYLDVDSLYFVDVQTTTPSLLPGNYYLLVSLDENLDILEKNENNNVTYSSQILISGSVTDLFIDSINLASTTIAAGSSSSFDISISNSGTDTLNYIYYTSFLSTDSILDKNDLYCYNYSFDFYGAQNYYDSYNYLPVSSYVPAGTYYLLVVVDYDNEGRSFIVETDESNNYFGVLVTITNSAVPVYDLNIQSFNLNGNSNFVPGEYYSLTYIYNNTEANTTPGYTYSQLYFSTDSALNNNDIYISNSYISSGIGNSNTDGNFGFYLSNSINFGDYYLIAVMNSPGRFVETNYNNNIIITDKISVSQNNWDFEAIGITTAEDTVATGQSFTIDFSVANNSPQPYNGIYSEIYLSDNEIIDEFDTYLTYGYYSDFQSMDTLETQQTISIDNVESGRYYLILYMDCYQWVQEKNEQNNYLAIPIEVIKSDVDFEITGFTIPDEITSSVSQDVTFTLRNNGTDNSGGFYVYYYISQSMDFDPIWSKNIDNYYIDAIQAGATVEFNHNMDVPDDIPAGNYYIMLLADYNNNVVESNENNNSYIKPVSVVEPTIDFKIANIDLSNEIIYYKGNQTVNVRFLNQGNTYIYNVLMSAYLSTDKTLDQSDYFINDYYWIYFEPGNDTSNTRQFSFNLPESFGPGNYYLLIEADRNNSHEELNENNNVGFKQFTITVPDIEIELTEIVLNEDTIFSDSYAYFNYKVVNNGTDISTSFYTGIYISEDNILDEYDYLLNSYYTSSLDPGDSIRRNTSWYATEVPSGTYYLIIKTDRDDDIMETNEENNIKAIPITVIKKDIDLLISNITLSEDTFKSGSNINISFDVSNQGSHTSNTSSVYSYLSDNTILDINDFFLDNYYCSNIEANSFINLNSTVSVSTALPGVHYIIIVADYNENNNETNEKNNITSKSLYILESDIDLISTSLVPSVDSVDLNDYIYGNTTTKNLGNDDCGQFRNAIYISSDTVLDFFDRSYGESYINNLASGDSVSDALWTYTYSYLYSPGDYYLINKTDYNNNIKETDETNNIIYSKFTIKGEQAFKPDMWFSSISIDNTDLTLGESFQLDAVIKTDSAISQDIYLGIVFSTDSILDQNDYHYENIYIGSFSDSSVISENHSLYFDEAISGKNYLFFVIDIYNYVYEKIESNNISSFNVDVDVPMVDIITSDINISGELMAGNYISLRITQENTGDPYTGNFASKCVLSKDTVYDILDKVMVNTYYSNIYTTDPNTEYLNNSILMPNIPGGNYYLINESDINESINESDENNNTFVIPVNILSNNRDIQILNFTAKPGTTIPGDTIKISFDIIASGLGKIEDGFATGLYISDDSELTMFDMKIEDFYLDSLNPAFPYQVEFDYILPMVSKKHYFILYADYNADVYEFDEENNMATTSVITKKPHTVGIDGLTDFNPEIYPNPASKFVNILINKADQSKVLIKVTDISGIDIFLEEEKPINNNLVTNIDVSGLAKGLYLMQIIEGKNSVVKKLIIN